MLTKVILQANIDKVAKYFERADKIVIVTHVSPDGDALGSSLGLLHFLETQEKNVHIIVPNAFPDFLRWMPGAKDIIRYDKYSEFADELIAEADVICCLDFNALSRIDAMAKPVAASAGRKVLIDHHLNPEDFCRVTISHPEISSTSELIFRLICRMGNFEDITREGAECIYTGMMTDTEDLLIIRIAVRFILSLANYYRKVSIRMKFTVRSSIHIRKIVYALWDIFYMIKCRSSLVFMLH